jgi:4'-phosphopantetheinyl transferase
MNIYWNLIEKPLNADGDFLSPFEDERLLGMRFMHRRQSYLLGRLAAKQLLQFHPSCTGLPFSNITIANRLSGVPYVVVDDFELPGCLSISHRDDAAAAALTIDSGVAVGIDLEVVEERTPGFVSNYFTPQEAFFCNSSSKQEIHSRVTRVWSAKEAVLKALGVGLQVDTRTVNISESEGAMRNDGWALLSASGKALDQRTCRVWWRQCGSRLLTLAAVAEIGSTLEYQPIVLMQAIQEDYVPCDFYAIPNWVKR